MDFMQLLKSIEALVYEIVSWLLFYPLTLWRTLRHPQEMMHYADLELGDRPTEQYEDTLSPPLFLLITLLLINYLGPSFGNQDTSLPSGSFLASDTNKLIFRSVLFSILPLLMATKLLRRKGAKLTRNTLRPPFFSQCYVTAPFALAISLGLNLLIANVAPAEFKLTAPATAVTMIGTSIVAILTIWYIVAETRWFMTDLGLSAIRSLVLVIVTILQALVAIYIFAVAMTFATGAVSTS